MDLETTLAPEQTTVDRDRAVIFVHGFTGSNTSWERMLSLLRQEPGIRDSYDSLPFQYETPLFNFSLDTGDPTIKSVADRLASLLGSPDYQKYREITLVGHSQGGLVIEQYLVDAVEDHRLAELDRIRQVILFATPNLGAAVLSCVRRVLGLVPFFNRQERFLRALNDDIFELQNNLLAKVLAATAPGLAAYPIPILSFYGTEDALVPKASAAGHFRNYQALKGNHASIIRPENSKDERFLRFKEALDDPWGHIHVFEVDQYENYLAVQPCELSPPFLAKHGNVERLVHSNNLATLKRTVRFSRHNQCDDSFEMRYGTREGGFVGQPVFLHPNEAPLSHTSFYDDYGTSYTYQVRPAAGATYTIGLTIYGGFDEGNRRLHFHLRKRAYIKQYKCVLDLTAYISAGFTLSEKPTLYFEPGEYPDHAMCDKRVLASAWPYLIEDPQGRWAWELENVRVGTVDIRWNVMEAS